MPVATKDTTFFAGDGFAVSLKEKIGMVRRGIRLNTPVYAFWAGNQEHHCFDLDLPDVLAQLAEAALEQVGR